MATVAARGPGTARGLPVAAKHLLAVAMGLGSASEGRDRGGSIGSELSSPPIAVVSRAKGPQILWQVTISGGLLVNHWVR